MKFSAEQLLRAMAPIDVVIDAFLKEEKVSRSCDNNVDVSQGNFATLIASTKDVEASGIENIPALSDTESEAIDWDGDAGCEVEEYEWEYVDE